MTFSDAVLQSEPVAYWRFNDPPPASTIIDASGNGLSLSNYGAVLRPYGRIPGDGSVEFGAGGSSSTLLRSDQVQAAVGYGDISAEVILRHWVPDYMSVIGIRRSSSDLVWQIYTDYPSGPYLTAYLQFSDNTLLSLRSNRVVADGNWHHIVMTRQVDLLSLYIDGELDNSTTCPAVPLDDSTEYFMIGASGRGDYYEGFVDDAAVYNRALSAAEIQTHYATLPPAVPAVLRGLAGFSASPNFGGPIYRGNALKIATRDQYCGGAGRIRGTVTVEGDPAHRWVLLLDRRTHIVIRAAWSDETGRYEFDWIDDDRLYTVLAHDYTRQYNAVVADNVTPEIPEGRA